MSYSEIFKKEVKRRSENSRLIEEINKAVVKDIEEVMLIALTSPRDAINDLITINIEFHKVFMKVRWADVFKTMPEIRYELADTQKIIDATRSDLRMMSTIYMSENKTNG